MKRTYVQYEDWSDRAEVQVVLVFAGRNDYLVGYKMPSLFLFNFFSSKILVLYDIKKREIFTF